ncbi:major capsid protein, partial [Shewanella sp.]|uniref:major capsid protein n=1 Tax=Shewanella sp. TaxID=50422 RepID=UPI003F2F82C7
MALSDMKIYNDEIVGLSLELLAQNIQLFNAASGGAIVLEAKQWKGNYTKESFFQSLAAAQRRVVRTGANAAQTAIALAQGELVGVKV